MTHSPLNNANFTFSQISYPRIYLLIFKSRYARAMGTFCTSIKQGSSRLATLAIMQTKHTPLICFLVFLSVVSCAENLDSIKFVRRGNTFSGSSAKTSRLDLPSGSFFSFKRTKENVSDPSILNSQDREDGKIKKWTNLHHSEDKTLSTQQATSRFNTISVEIPLPAPKGASNTHSVAPAPRKLIWEAYPNSTSPPVSPKSDISTKEVPEIMMWNYKGFRYLFDGTTTTKTFPLYPGKVLYFENYRIVTRYSDKEMLILAITNQHIETGAAINISRQGLFEYLEQNSRLGITGMILRDTEKGFQAQYIPGPLKFVVDGKPLFPISFDWSPLEFQQITVSNATKTVTLNIRTSSRDPLITTKNPVVPYQPHMMEKSRDLTVLNRPTLTRKVITEPKEQKNQAGSLFEQKNRAGPLLESEEQFLIIVSSSESEEPTEQLFSFLEPEEQFASLLNPKVQCSSLPPLLKPTERPLTFPPLLKPNVQHSAYSTHSAPPVPSVLPAFDLLLRPTEQSALHPEPKERSTLHPEPKGQSTLHPEPKEQSTQYFSGDCSDAFHSYKGSTQLKVSKHLYGIVFSGEEYRILMASVGSSIAILVLEEEGTDAASILNRVITNGLNTAAEQVKGLSGLLIREGSPRVMEFVEGPLSVNFANNKTLSSQTLPEFYFSWEHRISDSNGKFSVVFQRSYRYFRATRVQKTKQTGF